MKKVINSIAIVIPYFGKWPEWIDVFFDSCARNDSIDFIFFTDCEIKSGLSKNLKFVSKSFPEYCKFVSEKLKINFSPKNAYKLCDLKPFYGFLHEDLLINYAFYGFGDLDLFFGDIRSFYTNEVLNSHDVVSTHDDRISGHLALFRNNEENRLKVFKIKKWKEKLENQKRVSIDEDYLTRVYFPIFQFNVFIKKVFRRIIGRQNVIFVNNFINSQYKKTWFYLRKKLYFKEQYTTPLNHIYWLDGTLYNQQPDIWYYHKGEITNNRDVDRKFIYIHFLNLKSNPHQKNNIGDWEKGFFHVQNITSDIVIKKDGIFEIK